MPTWMLLAVVGVVVVPLLVCLLGEYLGWDTHATCTLACVAEVGPVSVLAAWALLAVNRDRFPSAKLDLPAWMAWTMLLLPASFATATVIWAYLQPEREPEPAVPDDWCARCNADLHADHAGRFYSLPGGEYLCPPPWRRPGQRRHQAARACRNAADPT